MVQNVTFISKNDENDDFSLRHSPFVNSFGADFLHFTIFAVLQNDEMLAWAGRAAAPTMNYRFPFFVLIFWSKPKKGTNMHQLGLWRPAPMLLGLGVKVSRGTNVVGGGHLDLASPPQEKVPPQGINATIPAGGESVIFQL